MGAPSISAATRSQVAASEKSPATYERRDARRWKTSSSSCSPVPTIDSRARSTRRSTDQSSTATPRIGQSRRPRFSSRYSDRNVITLARSPVIPKMTNLSARVAVAPGDSRTSSTLVGASITSPLSLVRADNGRLELLHRQELEPELLEAFDESMQLRLIDHAAREN